MKKFTIFHFGLCLLLFLVASCHSDREIRNADFAGNEGYAELKDVFQLVSQETCGIDFVNKLTETPDFNVLTYDGIYQGAGVGILDINNDGLSDVILTANMVGDRIYLNEGNLKFKDVTGTSGLRKKGWTTGVSVVDINADGFDDIYLCKFLLDDANFRKNELWINQKDGTFKEAAEKWGIADSGYTIHANFFDYDLDGDLDLYVVNQPPNNAAAKRKYANQKEYDFTDRLFRNEGNESFLDVTGPAGITNFNYSLSATACDFDQDGWPDIYVAADYEEPDQFFHNNGDGTFTDIIQSATGHISNFSMGADIADINADGLQDLYVVDMVAEDNFRSKTNMSGMNPSKFWGLVDAGYHYQYMQNVLQLNQGDNVFSEVAQMAGVSNTDWSWSALFMDLDLDGMKDLFVTNGFKKEVRNKDFEKKMNEYITSHTKEAQKTGKPVEMNLLELLEEAPSTKLRNYLYKNNGDLSFDKKEQWGMEEKGWSQGAAYADFDLDGDLDVVINNCDGAASLYKNTGRDQAAGNYLTIQLNGPKSNTKGIGAYVEITNSVGNKQSIWMTPYRGYLSSQQCVAHFGLANFESIDEVRITWPDGKQSVEKHVDANAMITISYAGSVDYVKNENVTTFQLTDSPLSYKHEENEYDDFKLESLIPHKMSSLGPIMARGDVNGDKKMDYFIGASTGIGSEIWMSSGNGYERQQDAFIADKTAEDGGAEFADLDGDRDLDLIVTCGSNELPKSDWSPRIYINDGKANFTKSNDIPKGAISGGKAVICEDFDADGDMDIFFGARQVPSKYGLPGRSMFWKNEQNGWSSSAVTLDSKDKSGKIVNEDLGMVSDGIYVDLNADGKKEMVLVGEWMSLTVLKYEGKWIDANAEYDFGKSSGWWNCVQAKDIDNDGDLDLIAGNVGLNTKFAASETEPLKLFAGDIDRSGTHDSYLGYYEDGVCYPVRGRQCSSEQMPFVKKKYDSYEAFAKAPIEEVIADRPESVLELKANCLESSVFLNQGGGNFDRIPFPKLAQMMPIQDILVQDFNGDGNVDLIVVGNYFDREVETTRSDAGVPVFLSGLGNGHFEAISARNSGLNYRSDARAVFEHGENGFCILSNDDLLKCFEYVP